MIPSIKYEIQSKRYILLCWINLCFAIWLTSFFPTSLRSKIIFVSRSSCWLLIWYLDYRWRIKHPSLFQIIQFNIRSMYTNDIFAKKFMTRKNSKSRNVHVLYVFLHVCSLILLWPWQGWPWWIKKPISARNKNFCVLLLCN